jgi:hypothetical protein
VSPTGGDIAGTSSNSAAQWYSVPAMACRRVALTDIKVMVPPEKKPMTDDNKIPLTDPDKAKVPGDPSNTIKPSPNLGIEQKIKDGIS